jgi:(p)ppGpp synthase/HD superfamily hydrolase
MTRQAFETCIEKWAERIEEIRQSAHELHRSVNQSYGDGLPYGYHLDMVAEEAREFGYLVCEKESDVVPMMFGAYYHDSIEDARLTYNDVMKIARNWMDDEQALMAAEIVFALTNDKGRTRKERAGEKYYQGIRTTPYAPFVKLADRLANTTYSFTHSNGANLHMKSVYRHELPGFLEAITVPTDDPRFTLPQTMIDEILQIVNASTEEGEK